MNAQKRFATAFFLLLLAGGGCINPVGEQEGIPSDVARVTDQEASNIRLTAPQDATVVTSPLNISGSARVFENVVNWRITNNAGDVLSEGFTSSNSPDVGEFGNFEDRIFLPALTESEFILQVFDYSAKDGSMENVVERHLRVDSLEKSVVNVYFIDPALQQNNDCSEVDFEKRTMLKTQNVAELAVEELLQGPTSEWAVTEVPDYTTLNSISIQNGTAYVDFDTYNINAWNGGACKVTALRAQIEQTLLQFPTVDRVAITVNGESEEILQP